MGLTAPWCLALCLLTIAATARAEMVANLYDAAVPVKEQTQSAFRRAAAKGLERVLIRVSGRSQVSDRADIASALANPEPLVVQYRYHQPLAADTDPSAEDDAPSLVLELSYSPRQVNALLQSAGLPVWSANRPSMLVWLVADTASGRRFVGGGEQPELQALMTDEAERRGLPLQFPLFDLTDTANLSVNQVWQLSATAVREASQRYGSAYILVGRASEFSTGQWVASWLLLDGEVARNFESEGMGAQQALASAVDRVADVQAERYAVFSGGVGAGSSLILIDGIADFHSYAALMGYLESLAIVRHANSVWVSDKELVVDLVLNDDMEKAQRFLAMDGRLQEVSGSGYQGSPGGVPPQLMVRNRYRWVGAER
ncbi:DUF2066 domain-containing protein [Spongiibacter nanhainus]|uniref:DUF2066 domain-containing protein n=1 Tax=Spongiibacter nanhainus TaxID=2794344 RepID=A0A7T4QZQ0_9GAMM|nr:DUF2066 domain-containing protein [Spongiibacter nanhainus]QQD17612.1 DUF2066 domain-containing protein [Spongiibacter nanhainus]